MPTERATLPISGLSNNSQITGVNRIHGIILTPGNYTSTATLTWATRNSGNRVVNMRANANGPSATYEPALPISVDDAGSSATGITITLTGTGAKLELFVNDYTNVYGPHKTLVSTITVRKETYKALVGRTTIHRSSYKSLVGTITVSYTWTTKALVSRVTSLLKSSKSLICTVTQTPYWLTKALVSRTTVLKPTSKALVCQIDVQQLA